MRCAARVAYVRDEDAKNSGGIFAFVAARSRTVLAASWLHPASGRLRLKKIIEEWR